MSNNKTGYWTNKEVNKLKKFLKSKKGQELIEKISKETKSIADDYQFTWEEWCKIKDVPFI